MINRTVGTLAVALCCSIPCAAQEYPEHVEGVVTSIDRSRRLISLNQTDPVRRFVMYRYSAGAGDISMIKAGTTVRMLVKGIGEKRRVTTIAIRTAASPVALAPGVAVAAAPWPGRAAEPNQEAQLDHFNLKVGDSGAWQYKMKIIQVIDDKNMICGMGPTIVWIKGMETKGLADDTYRGVEGKLKVTGTKRYTTSGGSSKTVFVIEPVK